MKQEDHVARRALRETCEQSPGSPTSPGIESGPSFSSLSTFSPLASSQEPADFLLTVLHSSPSSTPSLHRCSPTETRDLSATVAIGQACHAWYLSTIICGCVEYVYTVACRRLMSLGMRAGRRWGRAANRALDPVAKLCLWACNTGDWYALAAIFCGLIALAAHLVPLLCVVGMAGDLLWMCFGGWD